MNTSHVNTSGSKYNSTDIISEKSMSFFFFFHDSHNTHDANSRALQILHCRIRLNQIKMQC